MVEILKKVENPYYCQCKDIVHEQPCQGEGAHYHYYRKSNERYWVCVECCSLGHTQKDE